MKKIVFGITGLTLGGAERTLVDIANRLCYRYDVTIFCLYAGGELEKELSNKIKLIHICKKRYDELSKFEQKYMALKMLFCNKFLYKTYIWRKFDKEIAFLEGPITRTFSVGKDKKRKIAWVHNDISKVFGKSFKSRLKAFIDKFIYKKYGTLVFVSNDNLKKFESTYKTKNNKKVIYNFIEKDEVLKKSNSKAEVNFDEKTTNFVSVCRLVEQKAVDRLINVHSKLIKDGLIHNFYIVGDGPKKADLENLIKEKNVQATFHLLGKKENPYPYIKKCDIFALMSLYEGLPMTILESKILDKPILITNTAAREAVQGYYKSYITENTKKGIYDGIKNCIELLPKWEKIEKKEYYENSNIIKQIEKLVN